MRRRYQPRNGSFTDFIERNDQEIEVFVSYRYYPGTPDVMYMDNGDPGYPGDSPSCEITACKDWQGNDRLGDLSEEEIKRFEQNGSEDVY
jgi:hypothetical protein